MPLTANFLTDGIATETVEPFLGSGRSRRNATILTEVVVMSRIDFEAKSVLFRIVLGKPRFHKYHWDRVRSQHVLET